MKVRKLTLTVFGALGMLVVGAAAVWACSANALITLGATHVAPGDRVSLEAKHFERGPVRVTWVSTGEVIYQGNGPNFAVPVTIPAGAPSGAHYIQAHGYFEDDPGRLAGHASAAITVNAPAPPEPEPPPVDTAPQPQPEPAPVDVAPAPTPVEVAPAPTPAQQPVNIGPDQQPVQLAPEPRPGGTTPRPQPVEPAPQPQPAASTPASQPAGNTPAQPTGTAPAPQPGVSSPAQSPTGTATERQPAASAPARGVPAAQGLRVRSGTPASQPGTESGAVTRGFPNRDAANPLAGFTNDVRQPVTLARSEGLPDATTPRGVEMAASTADSAAGPSQRAATSDLSGGLVSSAPSGPSLSTVSAPAGVSSSQPLPVGAGAFGVGLVLMFGITFAMISRRRGVLAEASYSYDP